MLTAPAVSRSASAQEQITAVRDNASMRLGVFYLTPSLSIDRVGYDNNVLNSEGDRQGAFTASVTPRSTIWLPLASRALVTTNASVGFSYFSKFSSQGGVSPNVNSKLELFARRLTFSVDAGISSLIGQPTPEIERRVRRDSQTFGAGVELALGRGLSIGSGVYRQKQSYDADEVLLGNSLNESLNRREEGVRLTVKEKLTSLTTVGVVAETRNDRFELSPERDADGYRVAATIELAEKALIAGTAEVGFRHVDPASPTVPAFSGLVARVGVTNRLPGLFSLAVGWDRDMQYSLETDQPYYVTNQVSGTLRRAIADRYQLSVGARRGRSTYETPVGVVVDNPRRDRSTTYTADIAYRLSRDTQVGFGVDTTRRAMTPTSARDYRTTRAGFSLNHVF